MRQRGLQDRLILSQTLWWFRRIMNTAQQTKTGVAKIQVNVPRVPLELSIPAGTPGCSDLTTHSL